MTFIDIVLIAVFIGITATGFFQGTIRIAIALVAFYASIVLSSLYFKSLSAALTRRGTSGPAADATSFFVILLLCFILLFVAGVYTFRYVRLPGRLDYVDRIVGTLLGVVLAGMVGVILAMVLNYAFVQYDPAAQASMPLTSSFQRSVRGSTVMPLLLEFILPRLYGVVGPFLPDAAQPFFDPAVASS